MKHRLKLSVLSALHWGMVWHKLINCVEILL
ncbi:MAG: hypothetical protein K2P51_04690 [Rhabdochlamydiaceae bacterium]|nr:hypothetical protein [Rhabdochlamydiaceae bacterium]